MKKEIKSQKQQSILFAFIIIFFLENSNPKKKTQ